ncbi:MAG: methionyl-tRNA formyltransferase [Candidatus Promineifilaceae bacterium]|nr:methionyl-tRNA formyltransferase [Candidatus Promineifilaceae bacterium]
MARVVFMGTPDFAVPSLQALLGTQEVVGVVTQPDRPAGRGRQLQPPPVKDLALEASVPVYQPKSLRPPEAAGLLHEWRPDVIVVAAFGQILRPHVLNLPPHGCVNVHASLLPRWRGAAPIQHAILAGDSETGISLMLMDEGLDTGPVYVQRAILIRERETAASLHDRLARLGAELLAESLDAILLGQLEAIAQDETLATYAPLIKKEDGAIDWQQPAAAIDRLIRAMTPWPGAFSSWQGRRLELVAARPAPERVNEAAPGQVLAHDAGAAVATGQGLLIPTVVQLAGKRAMAIEAFLHGHPDFVGSQLG